RPPEHPQGPVARARAGVPGHGGRGHAGVGAPAPLPARGGERPDHLGHKEGRGTRLGHARALPARGQPSRAQRELQSRRHDEGRRDREAYPTRYYGFLRTTSSPRRSFDLAASPSFFFPPSLPWERFSILPAADKVETL